jgi:Uncharacterized conserved protein (COG2071)
MSGAVAAAAEAFARPRPGLHGLDATTTLEAFALVTFAVDPVRLRAVLPAGLEPETRRLDDGGQRGFVSAVSFRDVDFRFAIAPRIRASFFQTNYRAYVLGPDGRRAVFFFGTTLDSPLVVLPRLLWGMLWTGGRTRIEASWAADDHCVTYRHRSAHGWGAADVELEGTGESAGRLDGFADADDAAEVITHPLDGYFQKPNGRLGRYAVWHDRLRPELGHARRARYAVFEQLGLVSPDATPHSVLLQRSIDFDVLLPPRSV